MGIPRASRAGILERVGRDLEGHLKSLRRKLQRAVRRGEPVDRLQARIRSEENLLRRMRANEQGPRSVRGLE